MSRVRVTFTLFPLMADPQGVTDALNRTSYIVSGPGVVSVAVVNRVSGDPASVELWLSGQLLPGTWTVTVANVQTTFGEALGVTSASVLVTTLAADVVEGNKDETAEDLLRRHMNPALTGRAWDALLAAIALADQKNWDNAESAFDQLFLSSAGGRYLDRKGGDSGVLRPVGVGMSDDLFRRLAVLLTSGKLTQEILLELLEIFYGEDALHAWASTALAAPFALTDLDDLTILIDEKTVGTVIFNAADFHLITQASAVEAAGAITRSFQTNQVPAYALAWTDAATLSEYVKIYSSSRGLASSVRVQGGRAQNVLQFPDRVAAYNSLVGALPTWDITVLAADGRMRFTAAGANGLDLSLVRQNDYVTIYGSEFNAANRGTFTVLDVYQAYPAGVLTQYFEVANVSAVAQAGLAQVADVSLFYFRPSRQTVHRQNGGVTVEQTGGTTKVSLPATSQAVTRAYLSAAYLTAARELTVTSLTRAQGGVVTLGATAHGLTVGQQVEILGAVGSTTLPTTTAGDLVGPPLKTAASHASIWAPLKNAQARRDHSATLLADGRALLVAGYSGAAQLDVCELLTITATTTLVGGETQYQYTWTTDTVLPAALSRHRTIRIAELSAHGKVLVAGGWDGAAALNTAYLYTPVAATTGIWAAATALNTARFWQAMCLLADGNPFVCGGYTAAAAVTATSERYNSDLNTWTARASMATARGKHTATTLQNGSVLVCGGSTGAGVPLHQVEVYSPGGNAWSASGHMSWARYGHAAILLPDGRVLVIGGTGYIPSQPTTPFAIQECEIWDARLGLWSPAGRLATARSSPTVAYLPARNQIMVTGGGATTTEVLDLPTMRWSTSPAVLDAIRDLAEPVVLSNGTVLAAGGVNGSAVVQAGSRLLVPAADRFFAGGLNGIFPITAVPSGNSLQYQTPSRADRTVASGTAASAMAAQSQTLLGPHLFDPTSGPAVTAQETTLNQTVAAGHSYTYLDVTDATVFPDQDGWLVLAFGTARATFPVRYHGRLSGTRIKIDYTYVFPKDLASGTKVCLLKQKGAWMPANVKAAGALYITASNAGVAAASQKVDEVLAAGMPVEKTIVYPGDRGLGGEGRSVDADKKPDKIQIWGADD